MLRSRQKKDKRKKKAKSDDLDEEIENELKTQIDAQVSKPKWSDIWLYRLLCFALTCGPLFFQWLKLQWQAMRADKEELLDEEGLNLIDSYGETYQFFFI